MGHRALRADRQWDKSERDPLAIVEGLIHKARATQSGWVRISVRELELIRRELSKEGTPPPESEPVDYTAEEMAAVTAEVAAHPRRRVIEAIAATTFEIDNDASEGGGGMTYHLSRAYALVDAMPALNYEAAPIKLAADVNDWTIKAGDRLVIEDAHGVKHEAWALDVPRVGDKFAFVRVRFSDVDTAGVPWPLNSVVTVSDVD